MAIKQNNKHVYSKGKIVLRTNLFKENFTVEHKVLSTPLNPNFVGREPPKGGYSIKVPLIISPKSGYTIKAKDFKTGFLKQEFKIKWIRYKNRGNKVIAIIKFNHNFQNLKTAINIDLPIIGIARIKEDKFTLIETCAGDEDDVNIIVNTSSSYLSTAGASSETFHHCGDENVVDIKTYDIKNILCTKILVLSKEFIATDNHYFPKEPTYKITGNISRYSIKSRLKRDKKRRIISKTFDIHYTSPCESTDYNNRDTICFKVKSAAILNKNLKEGKLLKDREATKKEEYKIYSFNTGETTTAKGGVKRIEIKGIPGTPFRIIVQNNAKQTYNFETGVFEAGGGMLSGIIPPSRINANYGVYTTAVKVKRASAVDTISTRIITDDIIDHSKINALTIKNKNVVDNKIIPNTSLTFTVASTGFSIPSDSPIVIGPSRYKESSDLEPSFKIKIFATDPTKSIRIIRQPLHDISTIYYNWDSAYGSDTEKLYNSTGKEIKTDWNVSGNGTTPDNTEAKYIINTTAKGFGAIDVDGTNGDSYQYVIIEVTISGVLFGAADVTPELDLLNFLTIV